MILIKGKTDFLDPRKLKKLNDEYKKIKVLFRQASRDRIKSKWKEAQKAYEKYLDDIYKDDIDAIAELGEIYSHLCDHENAIKKFRYANDKQKYNPFYRMRLAENYLKKKDNQRALRIFENLQLSDRKNEMYMSNRAVLYVRLKDEKGINKLIKELEGLESPARKSKALLTQLNDMAKTKTLDPEILGYEAAKGIADNTQHQSQQMAVLLFLEVFKNATITQIKNECFQSNLPTTKKIINMLKEAKFIKEEQSFGGWIYSLTNNGKKEVKDKQYAKIILEDVYSKEKEEDNIGVRGTASLKNKYQEWLTQAKTK